MDAQFKEQLSCPILAAKFIDCISEYYPEIAEQIAELTIYGKHLDKEMMNEGIICLGKILGIDTPLWSMEEFEAALKRLNINFTEVPYNKYDLNFTSQLYAGKHSSLGSSLDIFIRLGIESLQIDPEFAFSHYQLYIEKCDN